MKLLSILLIFAVFSQFTIAQDTTVPDNTTMPDNTTVPEETPVDNSIIYVELDASEVENTPFILSLVNYGSQYVIGQAADSGLLSRFEGNYSKIYHVYQNATDSLNISAIVQLNVNGTKFVADFLAHYNPSNNLKTIYSFSYEYQEYSISDPSGINVTYNDSLTQYTVTEFDGFNAWLQYKAGNAAPGTFSVQDYLTNRLEYQSVPIPEIYSNQTIQGSLNVGLEGVDIKGISLGLLSRNAGELDVTNINSINTKPANGGGNYYRFDVQFENDAQNGRVVYVVLCPNSIAEDKGCANGSLQYYWFQNIQG